jgi:hypothetical protein
MGSSPTGRGTATQGLLVRQFLDATFPKRWIGRDGPTPWPPRSPDITPLDFLMGVWQGQSVFDIISRH